MARSSVSEKTRRVNAALELLNSQTRAQAAHQLADSLNICLRQAYRYLELADQAGRVLPVPEEKVMFTVKLPQSLVGSLRQLSQSSGETISELSRQALDSFIKRKASRARNTLQKH
jgi:predicted DNA-binding transcriptional regulator YafY